MATKNGRMPTQGFEKDRSAIVMDRMGIDPRPDEEQELENPAPKNTRRTGESPQALMGRKQALMDRMGIDTTPDEEEEVENPVFDISHARGAQHKSAVAAKPAKAAMGTKAPVKKPATTAASKTAASKKKGK